MLYVFPCVILFLCFSVLLVLRLPRLWKRELILVLFVRLFDLCLFGFVDFLFFLVSGKGCGLILWHSLDFSLTSFWNSLPNEFKLVENYPQFKRLCCVPGTALAISVLLVSVGFCWSYQSDLLLLYIYSWPVANYTQTRKKVYTLYLLIF